ncbi:FGGY-family carbohydrate kinase [Microterricola viridarii]|uniref:Xylulokinase n=1 Tax=Microterricola viridarii TaxID=412690 RepID=A0A1H1T296_9MICO|nr:FGGY family carbohydrate kinase [Microterricola viridarii]SDS53759.1 xylulokinase [Microterricola viridarii]
MTFIGIDIGTTRTKALLYRPGSPSRRIVASATPTVSTHLGDFRDAEAVFATVVDCISMLLADLRPAERAEIEGIGLTSLSEEVVLVTSSGITAGPMPAWYTSVAKAQALDAGIDPSFSWTKLSWAFEQLSSARSPSFTEHAVAAIKQVTTLNSYVAGRLAGIDRYPVDESHASRSGFFDVRSGQWQRAIFEQTGWKAELLPELVVPGSVVSTVDPGLAAQWGLPPAARVVLAGHDHFCGAFGNGVREDGQLYISAGTSEAHCLIVSELPKFPLPPTVGVGRFVDGTHFYLHRQLASGHLYRQWTGLLGIDDEDSRSQEDQKLFAEPIGSRGTTIIPGFDGDTSSSVLNVKAGSSPHTVLRALLEGLACAALHIDRELVTFTNRPIERIIASGIPCQSPFWQHLRGHVTAAPLYITDEEEAPALGAALLCQRATAGAATIGTDCITSSHATTTDASLEADYDKLFSRFERELARTATPSNRVIR